MTPDATRHDPRPEYLRALVQQSGLTQREIARRIGISDRLLRYYLTEVDGDHRVAPYPVQFALESLAAHRRIEVAVITTPVFYQGAHIADIRQGDGPNRLVLSERFKEGRSPSANICRGLELDGPPVVRLSTDAGRAEALAWVRQELGIQASGYGWGTWNDAHVTLFEPGRG